MSNNFNVIISGERQSSDKKIACCISGLPNDKIIDHLKYISRYTQIFDFFCFFVDGINDDIKQQIDKMLQPKVMRFVKLQQFNFDAKFKEPDKHEPKHSAFSMFYGISEVQRLRKEYEVSNKIKYDMVIRFRYDIHLLEDMNHLLRNVESQLGDDNLVFPFHAHHIGICDQLWFGRPNTMDKIICLFDWMRCNLDRVYFVNENILYRFLHSSNIKVSCIDIRYTLRRDNLLGYNESQLYNCYLCDLKKPWAVTCPEKRDGKYQNFIYNRNASANTVYFFTRSLYVDVPCKFMNYTNNKFISINPQTAPEGICGNGVPAQFRIHVYNCHTVNIFVSPQSYSNQDNLCLTVRGDKMVCTNSPNDPGSQFMMLCTLTPSGMLRGGTRDSSENSSKLFQFVLCKPCDNSSGSFGKYMYFDRNMNLLCDGARETLSAMWVLI